MQVQNINNLAHVELGSSQEKFSWSAILTASLGFKDLFVHHEIIPPGRRSSSMHRHRLQEEMIVVLTGNPTAYTGKEKVILKPGDFVGFKPAEDFHYIENDSLMNATVLVIGSCPLADEIEYNHEK